MNIIDPTAPAKPLNIVRPPFTPKVVRFELPTNAAEPHYRTPMLRPSVFDGVTAYLTIEVPEQEGCVHHFEQLDRFGDGVCAVCTVRAWSPFWVASGLYSEDTLFWIANCLAAKEQQVRGIAPVASRL